MKVFFLFDAFFKKMFFFYLDSKKEKRKQEAQGRRLEIFFKTVKYLPLSTFKVTLQVSLAYIYMCVCMYVCIFAVLQSLCTLRILRPKRSLHAMPMQILVFLWLCKKRKKEIYMHLILYKNKSIENYS